jgi:hypothetical protein
VLDYVRQPLKQLLVDHYPSAHLLHVLRLRLRQQQLRQQQQLRLRLLSPCKPVSPACLLRCAGALFCGNSFLCTEVKCEFLAIRIKISKRTGQIRKNVL